MALLMAGHAALMCGPPLGGAWCGGVWFPAWSGMLCRWVASLMVGHAALVWGPSHGGACCAGVKSPTWWGVVF